MLKSTVKFLAGANAVLCGIGFINEAVKAAEAIENNKPFQKSEAERRGGRYLIEGGVSYLIYKVLED